MKNKTNKTNKKKLMIFVLSLGVIALTATTTFSWFYFFKDAGIKSGDSIKVKVGAKLETKLSSEDETAWTNSITLNEQREDLLDITGDGKDFFYPTSLDENNNPRGYQHIDESGQGYYIELSLDFRASIAMDLYLNNTSKVKESAEFTASIFNKELDANAICGATRVAFLEKTVDVNNQVNEELKCIWIPNDDYHLYYDENDYNLPKIHKGDVSRREDAYYYYGYDSEGNENISKYEYTVDDYFSGKVIVGNTLANESTNTFGYNKPILSLDNQTVKTLIIRLWFEGTDRECSADLSHGSISYQFDFFGAKKKAVQDNTDSLKTIVGSGHLDDNLVYLYTDDTLATHPTGIEYSVDGIIWKEYTNESFDKTKISQVYLRLKETEMLLASKSEVLNLQTIELDKSNPDVAKLNAIVGSGSTLDKMISFYSDSSLTSRPAGIEYSLDGTTWQDYDGQSFDQTAVNKVYLRLKETDVYFASEAREINLQTVELIKSEPSLAKLNAIVGSGSTTDKLISFYSDDSLTTRPEGIEYSLDGETWQDYTNQTFDQTTTDKVYLRLKETEVYLASNPREINLQSITLIEPTAPKGDETNENI